MRKFSNITGQKVSAEPKADKKINEQDLLKSKILELMDQFLMIRTYGPVDRYQRAGSIKIAGKEVFLEALINLLSVKSIKDQTKLLESLKSEIGNWELIDNKTNEFSSKITECENNNKLLIQKQNILKTYNKYKDDDQLLLQVIEESCKKIKSFDLANQKYLSSEQLYSENKIQIFKEISEKFKNRANQIIGDK